MNAMRLTTFFPFLAWLPMLDRETVRIDFVAGAVAGVLILPQESVRLRMNRLRKR